MFFTDYAISAVDLPRRSRSEGSSSIWAPSTRISGLTQDAISRGGDLPSGITMRWTRSSRLPPRRRHNETEVGTGVSCPTRDSIPDGKAGRLDRPGVEWALLIGVGGGWNQDEMENHGTEFKNPLQADARAIEAMKEIWTKSKSNITATWLF